MQISLLDRIPGGAVRVSLSEKKESLVRVGTETVLELGIGPFAEVSRRQLIRIVRQIVIFAKKNRLPELALPLAEFRKLRFRLPEAELLEILAENLELANFEFVAYKTPPPEGWSFVQKIALVGATDARLKKALAEAQITASAVNACRRLANTPGGEMTPRLLADAAREAVKGTSVKITVLGPKEIKQIGMGGILGVAQGSQEEPRFIILEYRGAKAKENPIVLVGKGVTFDTGGLNLKPDEGIYEMHMDMSGGAAVIHAISAIAQLKLKRNVIGLVPAVENMPSGSSYRPGDLLRTLSGKTIEVLNTDAEGRIILADALTYAERYSPKLVIDVATLTGAAMIALGQRLSAVFSPDQKMADQFRKWGEATADYVWPMPLWKEYEEDIRGTFGDWANTGKDRYGGAIRAAVFLWQFAQKYPWVHLDIASRMTPTEHEFLAKGATGAGTRLLIKAVQELQ